MKHHLAAAGFFLLMPCLAMAGEEVVEKHREGSNKVADKQDELAADVQQLVIEQTVPQVIEMLNEVEKIMDEATDQLAEADTGGNTIAAQTEIIEKIHAAAKEKQKQQGGGQSSEAMMDMMERMMGKKPDGEKKANGKNGEASDEGSYGLTGESDSANDNDAGITGGKTETRRVPKAGGGAGAALPEEFRKAMDAYNRGVERKVK
ncbi:hypothetical protein JIN84_00765 [Luteolibacter yonseiensis]|uniref:Secreted protein n=1 Tax=Luteolibacter yonseiensis TaxID=1144680 RepID=A0A934QZV5_9BACT|nr:hypothetical protein [Luteolibacter yonseiensis]MBK1814139.1 hypothetical protein [Luteolibacter yonseiensis]